MHNMISRFGAWPVLMCGIISRMKNALRGFGILLGCLIAFAGARAEPAARPVVRWGESIDLGPGGYARIRPLADGRLMAAYERGGNMIVRFAPRADIRHWTPPRAAARHFTATNGLKTAWVSLANAEFGQLETGRIILATNLRPKDPTVHPFAIGYVTSDDAGATWSPLKVIYRCADAGDGVCRGCYEPFVLPQKGAAAQIYFADESPYTEGGVHKYQNISLLETSDGGTTWSPVPRIVSYTPRRRDGMPVVIELGEWRYLAIESNPGRTHLHPQIVRTRRAENWRETVGAPSPDRFDLPLEKRRDWTRLYGGAPYIAATENYVLLSWQERMGHQPLSQDCPIARVAAVSKKELSAGAFPTLFYLSTPPGMTEGKDKMLWNSLCALGGDTFLLVSQCNGRATIYPACL